MMGGLYFGVRARSSGLDEIKRFTSELSERERASELRVAEPAGSG